MTRAKRTEPDGRMNLAAAFVLVLSLAAFASALVPAAAAQGTVNVSIQNYAFNPSSITVVIGVNNTVKWTNNDAVTHTVTGDDGSWGSGGLSTGATYTHSFDSPGVYNYHCSIHPYMMGTVVVQGSGPATSSTTTSAGSSSSTSELSSSLSASSSSTSSAHSAATTASSSTSTKAGSSGGIPEFPYALGAVAAATGIVLASYLVVRQRRRPASPSSF